MAILMASLAEEKQGEKMIIKNYGNNDHPFSINILYFIFFSLMLELNVIPNAAISFYKKI